MRVIVSIFTSQVSLFFLSRGRPFLGGHATYHTGALSRS